MTIEQVRAMLSEKTSSALAQSKKDYETKRFGLYQHQSNYTGAVLAMPQIKAFDKSLRQRLALLGKECGRIQFSLSSRINLNNYSCAPCPPSPFENEKRFMQTVEYRVDNKTTDYAGRCNGGHFDFTKHVTIEIKGAFRLLLQAWGDDHRSYKQAGERCDRLGGMNIENQSRLLLLKIQDPKAHTVLEDAVNELIK